VSGREAVCLVRRGAGVGRVAGWAGAAAKCQAASNSFPQGSPRAGGLAAQGLAASNGSRFLADCGRRSSRIRHPMYDWCKAGG
jgi:hypothetical protein